MKKKVLSGIILGMFYQISFAQGDINYAQNKLIPKNCNNILAKGVFNAYQKPTISSLQKFQLLSYYQHDFCSENTVSIFEINSNTNSSHHDWHQKACVASANFLQSQSRDIQVTTMKLLKNSVKAEYYSCARKYLRRLKKDQFVSCSLLPFYNQSGKINSNFLSLMVNIGKNTNARKNSVISQFKIETQGLEFAEEKHVFSLSEMPNELPYGIHRFIYRIEDNSDNTNEATVFANLSDGSNIKFECDKGALDKMDIKTTHQPVQESCESIRMKAFEEGKIDEGDYLELSSTNKIPFFIGKRYAGDITCGER
tara:strand:- start:4469 stop:5401 length:933 start_codon:yes stop_codon:yes gene_type:complete